MVLLYKKHEYRIYGFDNAYIIHNTKKPFDKGHSHVSNFKTAQWLIDLAIHKTVPYRKLDYFLDTLIRISNDKQYIQRLYQVKKRKRK